VVDQASATIRIQAAPAAVMAVIADVEAYPQWSTGISAVSVGERGSDGRPATATFTLDAGILKDTYTLRYEWSGEDKVEWHLVMGKALKSQDGSYTLRPDGEATDVTYRLAVDLNIPMLGMFKRKAEKVIMDTALKGLKKRVES
jgi:ribosome-associated toxin RatA of RatAB toxin-antitoxin module